MNHRFPADDATHIKLAALRTQYVVGDYEEGAFMSSLVKVHPAQQPQLLSDTGAAAGGSTLKRAGTMIKGTLKGLGRNTIRRLRGGTIKKSDQVSDAEMKKINDKIVKEWSNMRGMSNDDAREAYMQVIQVRAVPSQALQFLSCWLVCLFVWFQTVFSLWFLTTSHRFFGFLVALLPFVLCK